MTLGQYKARLRKAIIKERARVGWLEGEAELRKAYTQEILGAKTLSRLMSMGFALFGDEISFAEFLVSVAVDGEIPRSEFN